ncbi:DMT family transporter [Portibacter lacus]|uniref:Permease n=1 Tax=Portibacter lacus TaxID=1099794 RepID=A0AA37WIQ1_9BACT|nr:EamA family transporter [Portibacter lacus]GLR20100.1 permease [Portibacter lacus]
MKNLLENRWFLLIIIALTWGSSFILIKKTLISFTPLEIGAFRVGVSGLIMSIYGIPALLKMKKKTLFWVTVSGFLGNFLPMFLFPIAQTHISSSIAGILNSLVPVFVLVLGFLFFGIKSRWFQLIGAVIGFIGAALLMYYSKSSSTDSQIGYALLIVLATICYATNGLIVKEKLQHVPSLQLSGGVFTIWMIPSFVLLIFSGFFENTNLDSETLQSLGYLSILTIMGTAIAMILYFKLIQSTSPIFASTVTYLLPVVAVMWGLIDGEEFSIIYVIGGLLILIGIYLIREKKKDPHLIPR